MYILNGPLKETMLQKYEIAEMSTAQTVCAELAKVINDVDPDYIDYAMKLIDIGNAAGDLPLHVEDVFHVCHHWRMGWRDSTREANHLMMLGENSKIIAHRESIGRIADAIGGHNFYSVDGCHGRIMDVLDAAFKELKFPWLEFAMQDIPQ